MDQTSIYDFLRRHRYAVVSSTSASSDFAPAASQSALVGIAVTPALEIVFDTLKTSRKYPNLIQRPACSLVIGWEAEQTVQYEGTAFEPHGAELERYQQLYFAEWPDGPKRRTWPHIAYLVVRPRWLRFSDYAQSPPLIEEMTILDAASN
jgi:hypothetical protein